jgi:hypothetical protein
MKTMSAFSAAAAGVLANCAPFASSEEALALVRLWTVRD